MIRQQESNQNEILMRLRLWNRGSRFKKIQILTARVEKTIRKEEEGFGLKFCSKQKITDLKL